MCVCVRTKSTIIIDQQQQPEKHLTIIKVVVVVVVFFKIVYRIWHPNSTKYSSVYRNIMMMLIEAHTPVLYIRAYLIHSIDIFVCVWCVDISQFQFITLSSLFSFSKQQNRCKIVLNGYDMGAIRLFCFVSFLSFVDFFSSSGSINNFLGESYLYFFHQYSLCVEVAFFHRLYTIWQ